MPTVAFASPFTVSHSAKIVPTSAGQCKCLRFAKAKTRQRPRFLYMSSSQDPELSGNSEEDDALNRELQQKVIELFGSRQNVSIDVETDSGVQFIVRKREVAADYRQSKAAWTVITSIAVLSVVAGVAFTLLLYTGAVHGSDQTVRRYEMPTYGKSSYIDPYELLEDDREFQDAQSFAKP